jgi:hypothetical protein
VLAGEFFAPLALQTRAAGSPGMNFQFVDSEFAPTRAKLNGWLRGANESGVR